MAQLEVTRHGRIVVLTMKRPAKGNRVNQVMADEITSALGAARTDQSIGACVITGHGDVFCLGGDYQGAGPTLAGRSEFARAFSGMHLAMAQLGKPLIAAVNGNAHAGGLSIVVACDLAIISQEATIGLPEAANGLFPFLALAAVKDDIPQKLFFDIVYNARLLNAQEAIACHLVNTAVPAEDVLACAVAHAERAASYNPDIVMLGRDLYYDVRKTKRTKALKHSRLALIAALTAKDREKETREQERFRRET